MDNLNNSNPKTESKPNFDWDAIDVGDYDLDHSENYFAAASANKENNPRGILLQNWNTPLKQELADMLVINEKVEVCAGVPLTPPNAQDNQDGFDGEKDDQADGTFNDDNLNDTFGKENIKSEVITLDGKNDATPNKLCLNVKDEQDEQAKPKLRLNWTPANFGSVNYVAAWSETGAGAATVAPPRAYNYKDVYQCKRETALRQRDEEERKARQFHSRPVPNFKALHKRLEDMIVVHRVTVPVTPETIKHSYADMERRKLKDQSNPQPQQQQQQLEQPNPANFARRCLQEVKPFKLHTDQRVRERREYDAAVQCIQAQKKMEQDEQRKKRELNEKKELRKMTEFRARPNPFK